MTSGSDSNLWRRFEHDPRDPAYAGMRASDRDRAVVYDVLAEAYAEGRLDREELDERTATVDRAKTYADLVPPIRDLTVDATRLFGRTPRADLERKAQAYYREKLGEAFMGLFVPNLICWVIWVASGLGFPWPLFVLIPTGANFARVAASKASIVEQRIERLERREAKELEPEKPKPPKPAAPDSAGSDQPETSGSAGPLLSENRQEPEET